jgi:hypothetical protein
MSDHDMVDVVVVGTGPAGEAAAAVSLATQPRPPTARLRRTIYAFRTYHGAIRDVPADLRQPT